MTDKVYIAGPMTGIPQFNFKSFDIAVRDLQARGYFIIFSPADHDRELLGKPLDWLPSETDAEGYWQKWITPDAPSLRRMLGDDLAWIAENATHLYMLKGWERSRGAMAEHALGVALGLEIMYE